MADNVAVYGIRWAKGYNGGTDYPQPVECFVASGAPFDVNGGAQNVALGIGDPVTRIADGSVTLCAGSEGGSGGVALYGIVVGVAPYYDSVQGVMRPTAALPDNVVYGTNLERQSKVFVIPVVGSVFEIDCDDAVTATTEAAYQALVGTNCDHVLSGVASVDTRAKPKLDISSTGTATAQWRIVGLSKSLDNQDFSGANVKLLVVANETQDPVTGATGI